MREINNYLMGEIMVEPTREQIVKARKQARLTQKAAAELIGHSKRSWEAWEIGGRKMHKATFEFFLTKAGLLKDFLRNN